MKNLWFPICPFLLRGRAPTAFGLALLLTCVPGAMKAADHSRLPVNKYGAPMLDAKGQRIKYDRKSLEAMARKKGAAQRTPARTDAAPVVKPRGFVPAGGETQRPFWQHAIFGTNIGGSNIVIGPTPPNGAPDIIIGGNAGTATGVSDDFWQVIRYKCDTGDYDQVFVSPLYTPREGDYFVSITQIGVAHVTDASDRQIVVMLEDGRIYLYDFATKTQLGYIDTGIYGLAALSLTDLDGDGHAELIATTWNDLYVFNGSGQSLWQVSGAGGYDVVAGRMDNGTSLKIAATNGKVIDADTHAVVWDYQNGFGVKLKLAPFPGENYQQLIAASNWQYVYSYDVGRQLPRWSIQTPQDIAAIQVADVDNDGVPEVIIGDGQGGTVHVHDLITQALKWEVSNPEHGVTNIAVGDVDHDGVGELLWGAGATSTGPDHLYMASTAGAHDIKWQSVDLAGPFLGPVIGDLDGDGQPELVIASPWDTDYYGGRILVFDLSTLSLRAMSDPVVAIGVQDLKLRDVESNGRMQIVIAAALGTIEIYRFDPNNNLTRIWTNTTPPEFTSFTFADVADLDNNGGRKIIGSTFDYVYIFDYPSGVQSWQSVNLANSNAVVGLLVEDLDSDGNKEIAALTDNGDLYTWDGPTRQLRNLRQVTNGALLSNRASPAGLVLGDRAGVGHFLQWGDDTYTETFTRQLAADCDPFAYPSCLNGLTVTSDDSLWTGTGRILNQRLSPAYDNIAWQSPEIGNSFGRFVATAVRNGQNCVFASALHAVVGLTYGEVGPTPTPTPTPPPCVTPTPSATPTPTATPRVTPRPRPTPRLRPTPPR